ncbi:hypothetical protein QA640_26525 [Bradyrhizobium sp. CB82]|nr:hypothetical protein [Bradyrhizobium sp. CB82]WFU37994.1 hypothetical protein QA640_26525 [Bradyrhizobium sp. CB82]
MKSSKDGKSWIDWIDPPVLHADKLDQIVPTCKTIGTALSTLMGSQ